MSARELLILGTASQSPTRSRNHSGAFLRWDRLGVLFDPGEGAQRQLLLAGVPSSAITDICITHLHGDHCLGLPGIVQRLSIDDVRHPVRLFFPRSGAEYVARLVDASIYDRRVDLRLHPVDDGAPSVQPLTDPHRDDEEPVAHLRSAPLDHRVPCIGWRLEEPAGHRLLPDALGAAGIHGPAVAQLLRDGWVQTEARRVTLDEVSEPRVPQSFAWIMDTRACDTAITLAEEADLVVCESTYLTTEQHLAADYGHLTAAQAASIAAAAKARRLVLTHYSQRYPDASVLADEARATFPDVVAAEDLTWHEVPHRR